MTALLDANVLIALVVADHVHHDAAQKWFSSTDETFATCPITEGALIRLLVREGQSAGAARDLVAALTESQRHTFLPDSVSYAQVSLAGVIGHRQVTDAYLAGLARANSGRVLTFDRGLVALHADVAELIPA